MKSWEPKPRNVRRMKRSIHSLQTPEAKLKEFSRWHHGCKLWTGHRDKKGRGVMHLKDKALWAQEEAWKVANPGQEIPKGLVVLPTCGRANCISPGHLVLGPRPPINVGSDNGMAKYEDWYREMVARTEGTLEELSEMFKMPKSTVHDVKKGIAVIER